MRWWVEVTALHRDGSGSPTYGRSDAGQWPRAIHSSRCGASAPIVVVSPWPVSTVVSAGSVSSRVRIESMIVGKSLNDRPVAPGPAVEQGVPGEHAPRSGACRQHAAGGVARACAARSGRSRPTASSWPSARSRAGATRGRRRPRASGRPGAGRSGRRSPPDTAAAALMWSSWPWVQTIAGQPCARRPPRGSPRRRGRRRRRRTSLSSPTSQTLLSTSQVPPSRLKTPLR